MTTEAETAGMRPQAKENRQLPGAGRGRNGFCPTASGGSEALQHLDFGQVMLTSEFWSPELWERTSLLP